MPLFGSEKDYLVKVIFGIDDAKYKQGIKGIQTSTTQAEKSVIGMQKSIAGIGTAVKWFIGLAAVGALTKWFADTAKMAAQAESAQHAFIASLKLTGRYTKETADDLTAFAEGLRQVVMVSDEEAKSAMTLAATLTDLDARGIKELTKSSIGLASTMGIDMQSAMRLLIRTGEGLTDTIRGTTIAIGKGGTEQERYNKLFDQTRVMFELAGEKLKTYEGRQWAMNEAYGEARERLGEQIIANQSLKALYEGLAKVFDDLVQDTGDGTSIMSRAISSFVDVAVSSLILLAKTISAVSFAWNNLQRFQAGVGMVGKTQDIELWQSVYGKLQQGKDPTKWMAGKEKAELLGIAPEKRQDYVSKKIASMGSEIANATDKYDKMDEAITQSIINNQKLINDLEQIKRNANAVAGEIENLTHAFKRNTESIEKNTGAAIRSIQNFALIGQLPTGVKIDLPNYPAPMAVNKYGVPYAAGKATATLPYLHGLEWAKPRKKFEMPKTFTFGLEPPEVSPTSKSWYSGLTSNQGLWGMAGSAISGYQQGGTRGAIAGLLPVIGSAFGPVGSIVGGLLGGLFGKKKQGEVKTKPIYAEITNFNEFWKLGTTLPSSFVLSGRSTTRNVDPHGRSAMLDWMVTGHQTAEFFVEA